MIASRREIDAELVRLGLVVIGVDLGMGGRRDDGEGRARRSTSGMDMTVSLCWLD